MMKKYCCMLAFFIAANSASADPRQDKVRAIMDAQGMLPILQKQMAVGAAEGERVGNRMMRQLAGKIDPSAEFKSKFEEVFKLFKTNLENAVGEQEIVAAWSKVYGEQFTLAELDKIVGFYTSDIGKKHLSANQSALAAFAHEIGGISQPLYQKITEDFVSAVGKVAKECDCPRKEK